MEKNARTRKEAKAAGEVFYSGGKACQKCGGVERYTTTGQCRTCLAVWQKTYSAQNRDKINARNRQRWPTDERRKKNQAAWRQANIDKCRKATQNWVKNNSVRMCVKANYRRLLKLRACPAWVDKESLEPVYQKARDMSKQTGTTYHVDHIVPINNPVVCGLHVPWNLQILTAEENIRKGNSFIVEGIVYDSRRSGVS